MNRRVQKSIIFACAFFFFCSCTETATDASNIDSEDQDSEIKPTTDSKNKNRISDPPDNEPGAIPTVVRSAVPPGYYGYDADTLQVSQYIRRIYQDKKGDLWLGTVGDGVVRYDGRALTYYTTREGFGGNSVQDIAEDRDGNLWFGTSGGVTLFDGKTFTNFSKKEGLSDNPIQSLYIDKLYNVWAGTTEGLCRYNPKFPESDDGKRFVSFPTFASSPKNVRNIMEDDRGRIWLATDGDGVYRYSGSSLKHFTEKDGLGGNIVRCIIQDKKGMIWFATRGGGLSRFNPHDEISAKRNFITFKEDKGSNEFETLFEDRYGDLWVAIRGGVRCYTGDKFIQYSTKDGLTNCCVQSIFEDRSGNLWFGSGAGLFLFNRRHTFHPCVKSTCTHDLTNKNDLREHETEISKTIINITKKGPWPRSFR